jgi:hypothetical protein
VRSAWVPGEGALVVGEEAESRVVAGGPLEVVHPRPGEVALHVGLAGRIEVYVHAWLAARLARVSANRMEAVVKIDEVRTFDTRGGNVRYVVKDSDGNEYTTFREGIGDEAKRLEGRRVRIEYHENQRGQYTNVYLDKVEPASDAADDEGDSGRTDPDEAAWRTAVEAAPWLVGESEPREEVPPDELYEKLKPFKERVAEDIREDGEDA